MLDKQALINWCWNNLQFDNCPRTWEDTYIINILNGYRGTCLKYDDTRLNYYDIRDMFRIYEDNED